MNKSIVLPGPRLGEASAIIDLEFSPAVLELTQRPPSPVRRVVGLSVVLAVCFGISALFWGHYDVVAVAAGKVVPKTKEKIIQPMEIGLITAIRVDDGQHVKQGEVLIELDPTIRSAELIRTKTQLDEQRLVALEAEAMLVLPVPRDSFTAPQDIESNLVATHKQQLKSRVAAYLAHLKSMQSQLEVKLATITKLSSVLPILREKESGKRVIVAAGAYPRMNYLDDAQNLINSEQQLKVEQAAAEEQRAQIQQTKEEFQRQAAIQAADAELKIREMTADYQKAKQLLGYQVLTAPVDGVVEQLVVHTTGGVVKPGDQLMVVIPEGDTLQVEAQVTNTDIGFVQPGQEVAIKVVTYDYQIYGFLKGKIDTLSLDAFGDPQSKNITFPVRVNLDRDSLKYDGMTLLLTPGMSVSAEIKTTQRRLIDYVSSVVMRYADESFRER